jgi:hypothetical protein
VDPRYQQIVLPSIWPRRRNTIGGDQDENENEEGDDTVVEPRDDGTAAPSAQLQATGGAEIMLGKSANAPIKNDSARQRLQPQTRSEDLRIPGHFR